MRYNGQVTLEVEGTPVEIAQIAHALDNALRQVSEQFPQVSELRVVPEEDSQKIRVHMVLDAGIDIEVDGTEELDEVADQLMAQTLTLLASREDSEKPVVLESALVPA